mgnify:CR=1 FL=1|tara:strand:+ start:148 stop:621 length:474 start_codon:yes stop_codon:yes gene_type:complete
MFFFDGFLSGILATLFFDLFQISLSYSYNIRKSKWNIVGRYFWGLKKAMYFRNDILNEPAIKYELIIGYAIHYFIGSIFGLIYVIFNIILFSEPSFLLALIIGFSTVLGAWCVMMPYAYNIGFFASREENQKELLVQNLIAHFIFGVGLFAGYLLVF